MLVTTYHAIKLIHIFEIVETRHALSLRYNFNLMYDGHGR